MNLTRVGALGVAWVTTIVIAVLTTRHLMGLSAAPPESPSASSSPAPSATPDASAADPGVPAATRLAQLERENADLRAKLADLRKDREKIGREYLNLALAQGLNRARVQAGPGDDAVRSVWESGCAQLLEKQERGMLGGFDQAVTLVTRMSAFGEGGIRFLAQVVSDKARNMKEREAALAVLSNIGNKAALDAILQLREPDVMELDYPYDLIARQVATLPTDDVAPFASGINAHIATDLGAVNLAPEKMEVLAYLALVHQDGQSLALLQDPRVMNEHATDALQIADDVHSPQAREFVVNVAQHHSQPEARRAAAQLLDRW